MYTAVHFAEEFGLKNAHIGMTLLNSTASHLIFFMLISVIMQNMTVDSKVLMVSEEVSLLKYPGEIRAKWIYLKSAALIVKYARVCYPSC